MFCSTWWELQNHASLLLGRGLALPQQHASDGLVEHLLQALLRERRALHVFVRAQLRRKRLALLWGNGGATLLRQTIDGLRVVSQVELGADQNEGCARGVVLRFWQQTKWQQ